MMNRGRRCAFAVTVLVAVLTCTDGPAHAFCIWGFGWCETPNANPIAGEYMLVGNPSTTLTITVDKITSKTGPVSLGHGKIEITVRYLGLGVDDALEIAEKIEVSMLGQSYRALPVARPANECHLQTHAVQQYRLSADAVLRSARRH